MRITAKQAKQIKQGIIAGLTPSNLDVICEAIHAAANKGRNSVILRDTILSDEDWQWLSINGFEVFKRAEYMTTAYLISWEFASV